MHDVIGIDNYPSLYDCYREVLQTGLLYPMETFCIVGNRPSSIKRNTTGQLHSDGSPALQYTDGFKIWALNGVLVPQYLAETRGENINCSKFAEIDNAEVRREFVRKVGVERILQKVGGEVLDKSGDYELVLIDLKGNTGKWPYLKMRNPSIGVWHLECVDRTCTTVQSAINFRASKLKHLNGCDWQPGALT